MSTRHAYLSTMAGSTAIQAAGIVTGILSARLLGPEGRGLLVLVILIPGLAVSFGNLSLPFATAYLISKDRERAREISSTAFWTSLVMGLGLMVVVYLLLDRLIPSGKHEVTSVLRWYIATIPVTFLSMSLLGIDHGLQRFLRYNVLRALTPGLCVLGMLGLWLTGTVSLRGIAFCYFGGAVAVAAVRAVMVGKAISPVFFRYATARRLLGRGALLHLPALSSVALMNIDRVMLARMVDEAALGYYAVALALAMGQYGIASAFMQVSFVKIAGEKSSHGAKRALVRHVRYAQAVILILTVLIALASPWLVVLMFGREFGPSAAIAIPLVCAKGLYGLTVVFDNALRGLGRSFASTAANVVGTATTVVLGLLLIPRLGAQGMAIAMLGAMSLMLALIFAYCKTWLGIPLGDLWGLRFSVIRDLAADVGHSLRAFGTLLCGSKSRTQGFPGV